MGIFAGDRPLIVGVLTAIGVEQGVPYCRYRHQVGEANTSMAGFRQWKHALRQQPRVSPLHGTLGMVGVIAFYLAANVPHLPVAIGVLFGLLTTRTGSRRWPDSPRGSDERLRAAGPVVRHRRTNEKTQA